MGSSLGTFNAMLTREAGHHLPSYQPGGERVSVTAGAIVEKAALRLWSIFLHMVTRCSGYIIFHQLGWRPSISVPPACNWIMLAEGLKVDTAGH
jgi:hypothetical protein